MFCFQFTQEPYHGSSAPAAHCWACHHLNVPSSQSSIITHLGPATANMATNGNVNHQEQYTDAAAAATADASSAASSSSNLSKDEVGWYFVEQYYNTLSKTPEKLHVGPPPP